MKRKLLLSSSLASALLAAGAMAQVVNFHDANNGYPLVGVFYPAYNNELFAGQGAYADPGNNIWNGFGAYYWPVYQSTLFYSGSPGGSGPWPQQAGNPGNPYAAYVSGTVQWVSSTGSSLFDFATGSPTISGNADSSGTWTPVTLAMDYWNGFSEDDAAGFGLIGIPNGTPAFLLGNSAYSEDYTLVPPSWDTEQAPLIGITLQNVPAGTGGTNSYGIYIYSANWDNSCGATFTISSGNAHNGITAALNSVTGTTPASTFVEGQNFVIFENVKPDANGNIHIGANPNPAAGVGNLNLAHEVDVCGFQLIFNPPPTAVSPTAAQNVLAGGTANFSFSPAFAAGANFQWQFVSNSVNYNLSDGAYNGATISGSGSTNLTVAGVTPANVGLYQCVITAGARTGTSPAAPLTILAYTGGNILQAGDTLTDYNNNAPSTPDNTIPPAFYTSVANVEDGTLVQYENYGANGDVAPFSGPVSFVVTPQIGSTVVTGMRLFTSWGHPEDDPKDYQLEGSTDGGSTFTHIAGGFLSLPAQRNAAGGPINITNQVLEEVDFANTTAYTTYQVTFTNVNNNTLASNGVQVAEIQLLAPAPIIVQQPTATNHILAGGTFNAIVIVNGADPMSYQWYNGAGLIVGATNATYTLANVTTSDSGGSYYCTITSPYGSVTTTPTSLTVITPTAYEAIVMGDEPLAFFPLNETGGTTAYDCAQAHNGTYLNSPSLNVSGPSSTALPAGVQFDGASQYVLVPETAALNFGGQVTLEAWVQPNYPLDQSSLGDILARGYDANQADAGLEVQTQGSLNNAIVFYGGYYDNFVGAGGVESGAYPTGSWTHLVLTWDGAYWNLYTNGVLTGLSANSVGARAFNDPWGIANGTATGNGRFYSGNICAAAIYNHALTPAQVMMHYVAGAGVGPAITSPPQDSVVIANSNVTMSVTAIGIGPLTYQWYNGYPSSLTLMTGATSSTLTFNDAQSASDGSYYVVVTGANGLTTTSAAPATLNVVTSPLPGSYFASIVGLNPLAYWPLNETVQPTPYGAANIGTLGPVGDAIYNGTIVYGKPGALADTTPGDTNRAIATDGSTAYVALPYSLALSNPPPFTVEAWLQTAAPGTEGCALACEDAGEANGNGAGWLIYMDATGGAGYYNFRAYNKNALNTSIDLQAPAAVTANTWHYVAVVVNTNGNPTPNANGVYPANSITATMYLDGQTPTTATGSYAMNDDGAFTIGVQSDISFFFAGQEDEVAYYTNALSPGTIAAHYAAGMNATPATPYYKVVNASNPLLFYQLDETGSYPSESTEPLAVNYGATGASDNGYYLPGAFPALVPGPNVAGFPAKGANNVAVSFNHEYWLAGGAGNWGITGFIDVPVDGYNSLNVLGPVTLAAWIQATPNDGRFETPVGRGDNSYQLDVDGNNQDQLHFAYGGAGDLLGVAPAGNINDGNWHFVVGAWDGQTQSLYVDGVLNATNATRGIPAGTNDLDFTIGEAPDDTGRVFDGNIAQVAIFGYALSAAQVQSLYYSAEVAPFITQQPAASLTEPAGTNVTLSVAANGSPTLVYQWLKGGLPVSGAEYSGANSNTLTITGAAVLDSGSYSVTVNNGYGAVVSSVTALSIVGGDPVVETDISPLLTVTTPGEAITFSVTAAGAETLHYQWMQDGVPVSGATDSSYTFSALGGTHTYSVTISNAASTVFSSTAVVESYVGYPNSTNPPTVVAFNGNGGDWTINQGIVWYGNEIYPNITNNVLTLTDGGLGENSSAFYNTPQYVGSFIASYTYKAVPGTSPIGGGATFCIQNDIDGPYTVGGNGAGFGYALVSYSSALTMDLYTNYTGPGILFCTDGAIPAADPSLGKDVNTKPVDITSGDPINFLIVYNQNVMNVWLTDTTTRSSFSTNFSVVNMPAIVNSGANGTAYVGFTGGTGPAGLVPLTSVQTISNFVFSYTTTMTPTLSVAQGAGAGSVVVSWPVGVSPLFMLQEATALNGAWSNVVATPQVVGGMNQVTLTPATTTFFRLLLEP
jgi:hypothetical protein